MSIIMHLFIWFIDYINNLGLKIQVKTILEYTIF